MIPSQALAAVTTAELARSATMFTTIKQLRLRVSEIDEKVLDNAFETHVQSVLEKLNERLPQIQDSSVREAEVLMAKHGLFDAGFQQAILLCHTVFPALGDSLKDIRSVHSSFVAEFYRVIDDSQHTFADLTDQLNQARDAVADLSKDKETLQSRIKVLDKEAEELRLYIDDLRTELRDTNSELDVQRESIKHIMAMKQSNQPTAAPISQTNSQSNHSGPTVKPFIFSTEDMRRQAAYQSANNPPPAQSNKQKNSTKTQVPNPNADNLLITTSKAKYSFTRHQPIWLHNFRSEMQQCIDSGKCREFSLKECKDLIEKFFESKSIANEKASKGLSTYPPETMEQHVYRVFEKKFGLRNLAIEQAAKLFGAVQTLQREDSAVEVFLKVFKNEVEEDFWLVYQELKKSIFDLVMIQLVARFPTKDQPSLQKLFEKKLKGTVNEAEWTDMLTYLYDDADSSSICLILRQTARREKEENQASLRQAHLSSSPVSQFVQEQLQQQQADVKLKPAPQSFSHDDDSLGFFTFPSRSASPTQSVGDRAIVRNITRPPPPLTSQGIVHPAPDITDRRRLGYQSSSLAASKQTLQGIPWKESRPQSPRLLAPPSPSGLATLSRTQANIKTSPKSSPKSGLKLSFEVFLKTVLDFQLSTHERYLGNYRQVFHEVDEDCDGVLNIRDFFKCYTTIRQQAKDREGDSRSQSQPYTTASEELETFAGLVRLIDPMETDIITFSASATALGKVGMRMAITQESLGR